MTSSLKKFQLLKRKKLDSDECSLDLQKDQLEGPRDHQRSGSHDLAGQRTSQMLPLLVKHGPSPPSEVRKKLVLPELARRTPGKATASKQEERRPQLVEKAKEATTLAKLPVTTVRISASSAGRKKVSSPLEQTAALPEFADENFQDVWDSKVLPPRKSLREAVAMLGEEVVLQTIQAHLQQMVQGRKRMATSSKEKIDLYKYYGSKLRETRHKELVIESLQNLLGFSKNDEVGRMGVSEAIAVAASCHLQEIVIALRDYGNIMHARRLSQLEKMPEPLQDLKDTQVRTTLILCYGHAANGAKPEDLLVLADAIVTEVLIQFRAEPKDDTLKKTFMKSVVMICKALQDSQREDVLSPRKSELVMCLIEVIEDEPLGSVCVTTLHQAMNTVSCLTLVKPALDSEVRSELVYKSVKKAFSLPALKMTKLKAGSPTHQTQTQDFYLQTINVCNSTLTSLLSEIPNMEGLQERLIHTNGWIESEKTYERERAVRSTTHLLEFVSEHLDFDISQEFSLMGQLLALLALRTVDSVKEIGMQAAEAMYHLHYITMSKMVKEMEKKHKNRKGNVVKWWREDFLISGPSVFYNNISKVAKAFGEHLTNSQITDLVLKVIDDLMHPDKVVSQAASVLLSSFLEECGMDLEDVTTIFREIYARLSTIRDPVTKDETVKAICNLASKRLNGVVDCLLESSAECDHNAMQLWRALVSDHYSNAKLVRPLLKWLQDEDPFSENCNRRNSKSLMPRAATNALRWILSLPEAKEVIQGKSSHLLLALLTQIYYALGSQRNGSRRLSNFKGPELFNPLSSAVQALKNLITCVGYTREYNILGMQGSWEKLQHPDTYFEGVFQIVRTLFVFSKLHLKMTFQQATTYLRHAEIKERTVGMAVFTELLFHREIGMHFAKQDILDVLREWMVQPYPLVQIFSIRGLGHLLQHPMEDESLEVLLPPLISCALESENIAKESIKTLKYLFRHLNVEEHGSIGISLIPHVLKCFNDEDDDLRTDAIGLFGTLLKGAAVADGNRWYSLREAVFRSQVPLLIQLADPFTGEVSREVLSTCASFMKWGDAPTGLFVIENYGNLSYVYDNICKYLVTKYKTKLPEMLAQTLRYAKSKYPAYREAAAMLIGKYAPYTTADVVSTREVEKAYLALFCDVD